MGKTLLFASIAVTGLTAALGFLNRGKLVEARTTAQTATAEASKAKEDLAKAAADLKTSTENLAAVTAQKDEATAKLSSTETALAKATADLTAANSKVAEHEAKIAALDADNKQKDEKIKQLEIAPDAGSSSGQDTQLLARVQELETVNAKLQSDLEGSRSQLEDLRKEKLARQELRMRNNLEGRVLAVNQAWNFVVLNLGEKNGVVGNAEMLVKRGNQLIGKVRITTVDPNSSIADIVANSVPPGVTIVPGDNVIYQAVEE